MHQADVLLAELGGAERPAPKFLMINYQTFTLVEHHVGVEPEKSWYFIELEIQTYLMEHVRHGGGTG